MSETILERDLLSISQQNMEAYMKTHDVQYVTEDAVFKNMSSGEETVGREAIANLLHFFYHVAFDAKAELISSIITEDKALLEANFTGKHIGALGELPATQKEVNVPLIVSYDLENGLIKKARIYMLDSVMMQQLGVNN
ncbi:MAG: ester cyclase [Ferruginibacter sp.]